ncbi:hypothetical protein [Limosilactobacillus reuteri]|uniref:hypothetical protein n=1 Tax=Limosilactobacillus reuteri TaxID=1598 RepID=UPI001E37467F|nr:hypothetical protein [Limosilactobacillus reuteri]MCC4501818.1 hypothetical protein [Limosilactobacillus reuteri]
MQTKQQTISQFYERKSLNKYGNTYVIQPRADCSLNVLNTADRFVVLCFDRDDNYIVIANKRYYLDRNNAIKCTNKIRQRVALIDVNSLEHSNAYDFDNKFAREFTAQFSDFDELRKLAKQQYDANGTVSIKQIAQYDTVSKSCTYAYEPSYFISAQ